MILVKFWRISFLGEEEEGEEEENETDMSVETLSLD